MKERNDSRITSYENKCKKVWNFVKAQKSTLYFLYDYTPCPIFA